MLKGERLNMDDLSMLFREQSIFSMQEVDYAVLEPNGQLSVLKKWIARVFPKRILLM
ncbi:YetF domain-containing protein [Peribacillus sp. NPDC006672]|uniref:YetF domain-containing protein n=1 Tax=Peribacillus sp. NPDC006672 TaxID=3390606 RepID=UPI003CFC835F